MQQASHEPEFDVAIVGAGFSGLYLAHRATEMGMTVRVFEAGSNVGGTWYWNTYPGARCDVESIDYSYSFSEELQQEWVWSERYAPQHEILAYLNHVADRFDLRRHIEFDTRVTAARFVDDGWEVDTDQGKTVRAAFCVMATGGLSAPKRPDFAGLDDFRGEWFHTARWPAEGVDFTDKRVAVVGTGSTGIQVIPKVAEAAEHLVVLQRTPNFTVPARNRVLSDGEIRSIKTEYGTRREMTRRAPSGMAPTVVSVPGKDLSAEERVRILERSWAIGGAPALLRSFSDELSDPEVNETVADFVRAKIAEIVEDPETAAALSPTDYPFGARRLCADTDYFATFNRDNVELIDLRAAPFERITATGILCGGVEHPVDIIIFAIGFDAISGAVAEIDIRGRDDRTLQEYWKEGPKAALGLQVAGFPNFFLVNGPGSPAVLGNVVAFAEQHVEWITDCIGYVRSNDFATIESTDEFDEEWAQLVDDIAATTLYVKAKSWYSGDNIPGKPSRFLPYAGGLDQYRDKCDEIAADGYRPFVLKSLEVAAATVAS